MNFLTFSRALCIFCTSSFFLRFFPHCNSVGGERLEAAAVIQKFLFYKGKLKRERKFSHHLSPHHSLPSGKLSSAPLSPPKKYLTTPRILSCLSGW